MWYWLIKSSDPGNLGRLIGRVFLLSLYGLTLYFWLAH